MTCWVCIASVPVILLVAYKVLTYLYSVAFSFGSGIVPKTFQASESPWSVWAVVTGCTSGIGEGFVHELASRGFNVLMLSRSLDKLQSTRDAVKKAYPSVIIEVAAVDFTKSDCVASVIKAIGTKDVAVLINNVGSNVSFPKNFTEHTTAEMEDIINVNVKATTLLTHALLPKLLSRSTKYKGCIINISSLFGSLGSPMLAVYSASKAYLDSFSVSIAAEVANLGVQVFCCTPGYVVSNMSKIRNESLAVLSGRGCARNALDQASLKGALIAAPHWTHSLIYWGLSVLPLQFRLDRILSFHRDINRRAIAKLAKSQ